MSISSTVPTYRQLNSAGFWCPKAFLIEEGEIFEFDGEPNEHMEALNEPALVKLQEFYKKLDDAAEAAAKAAGRTFSRRAKDIGEHIALATADARKVELRQGDGGIPLMGGEGYGHVKRMPADAGETVIRRKYTKRDDAA